jgi:aldose 1-epimerase
MPIDTARFGTLQDRDITEYILDNRSGMIARIIDYGGIIKQLHVPGRDTSGDVVLGFDSLQGYVQNKAYLGAIIGRFANRIAKGRFILDGITRDLDINEPPNHLHGGFLGFGQYCWQSDGYLDGGDICLRLQRLSPDGEGGYPGNLNIAVIYRLTTENVLSFEISATTDQATPVSITQHSYFNLAGHNSGDIRAHQLQIEATKITPVDGNLIPTGELLSVRETPYDFTTPAELGTKLRSITGGFDCNYIINGTPGTLRHAATLIDPYSGRVMNVATTKPGIQLYDGSELTAQPLCGKNNTKYPALGGLCLETQHFPDAMNHPTFPSPILRSGEIYEHTTTFSFSIA